VEPFSDSEAVARYAEGPVRMVPGFAGMQAMAAVLLAEHVGPEGKVLVLGAGGGLELKAFAEMHPGWQFTGVDPSAEMLGLAERMLGPLMGQVELHQDYIDDAPAGPFDGATCLLTLHFLPREERLKTLKALHSRMRPGSPLVVAHHSVPEQGRDQWFDRFAAFSQSQGASIADPATMVATLKERLPFLSPQEDEDLLREAGFTGVALFYAAFTFRGWVGYRA